MTLVNNQPYRELKLFMGNADAALSAQELGLRVVERELRKGPYDSDKLKKYAKDFDILVNLKHFSDARHIISMNNILLLFGRFEQFIYELNASLKKPLFDDKLKVTGALTSCSERMCEIGSAREWGTLEMAIGYYRILRDINAHPRLEWQKKSELSAFRDKAHAAKTSLSKVLGIDGAYSLPEGVYVGYDDCVICSRALKLAAWQMTACLAIFGDAERGELLVELKRRFSSCFRSNPERFENKSVRHIQSVYRLDLGEAKYLYGLVSEGV